MTLTTRTAIVVRHFHIGIMLSATQSTSGYLDHLRLPWICRISEEEISVAQSCVVGSQLPKRIQLDPEVPVRQNHHQEARLGQCEVRSPFP